MWYLCTTFFWKIMMNIAIIDLGTNTCNLLVAKAFPDDYTILYQGKELVKLGDDRIRNNEISPGAMQRVISAFEKHSRIIRQYNVKMVKVIATSALRTASNKNQFLEELKNKTGYPVEVVTGNKEAELIFKGVLLAFGNFDEPSLILDIGGGSNEIILAYGKNMLWSESRPTGMARIINRFKLSDPVRPEEITMLKIYFFQEHALAIRNGKEKNTRIMVGCSGAFDTIADIIDGVNPGEKKRISQEIPIRDFTSVYEQLLKSSHNERLNMKGMDMVRVELIVPAVILIEQIITLTGITKIIQTDYALREGVLYDLLKQNER